MFEEDERVWEEVGNLALVRNFVVDALPLQGALPGKAIQVRYEPRHVVKHTGPSSVLLRSPQPTALLYIRVTSCHQCLAASVCARVGTPPLS